jgi:hypothetical protein
MNDHPCKYWVEGCTHKDLPHGARPSAGVCRRACEVYEGPDRGLGDTVARFTRVTGIAGVVERAAKAVGKDCGCGKRRARLNEVVSYEQGGGKVGE